MRTLYSVFATIGIAISFMVTFAVYCLIIASGRSSRREEENELKEQEDFIRYYKEHKNHASTSK